MISATQKLSTFLKKKVNSSTWRAEFLAYFTARQCLLCQGTHQDPHGICPPCLSDLPWLVHGCRRCGVQLPAGTESRLCAICIQRDPHYDLCVGLFHYEFPIREVIADFKFHNKTWYALPLGQLLAQRYRQMYPQEQPDLLLATPMHSHKLRRRGYNQALEIARIVSRDTRTLLCTRTLLKTRATAPQSELSARERSRNLRGSFAVGRPVADKHVLLIDDVATTGHTINEISRMLKRAGARRVDVLCVARTSLPRN